MASPFHDPEASANALTRIESLSGIRLPEEIFSDAASPDQALTNLENWLRATASPTLQLQQLRENPELGRLLILLLGANQPIADSLIRNPELSSIIFDPQELAVQPTREQIEEQGRALLKVATSFSHGLDRLRFLRQRWMAPLVVNDLGLLWAESTVWRVLSDLADAMITLAAEAVWADRRDALGLSGDCPLMIVAFGKLGGRELNYSSDVDLVYVYRDGGEEARLSKICEALTRAISERMVRGPLYRVDLRLRPFGQAGPVATSMKSAENYYGLYAEPWEVQAMLKSRPIFGPPPLLERWERLREKVCFGSPFGPDRIDSCLEMRSRTEADADPDDLKRARGGIRDVEFLVQILQLVHGHTRPRLRTRSTLETIGALEEESILEHPLARSLREGYTFLRQVEHRLQFSGDLQTHTLPRDPPSRKRLARLMGKNGWPELDKAIGRHRRTMEGLYQTTLHPGADPRPDRADVVEALGASGPVAMHWFDGLPESDQFYSALRQNRDSLQRVRAILDFAPRLVPYFRSSVPLTELLLSGEIEEAFDPAGAIQSLAFDQSPKILAETYTNAWTHVCAKWVLTQGFDLGPELAKLAEALFVHARRRLHADFDVVALGSLALGDFTLTSDADILLLVGASSRLADAENQARLLLGLISALSRLGAPLALDLRLRPEGADGRLVRTYEGFAAYELESMEMWERFALGQSRLLGGDPECERLVLKAAYAQPLTPERLRELLGVKKRIETERVAPQHGRRHVKLGFGGLSDIDWFVHLHEMRYPTATRAGEHGPMADRIRAMSRGGLINTVEVETLLRARRHLVRLRQWLDLQGVEHDVLPENPDKLDRLARAFGLADGNELLREHERVIDAVRAIYQDGLERLKP